MILFLRRFSRSFIFAEFRGAFGISSFILENPSHVLLEEETESFVAWPKFESAFDTGLDDSGLEPPPNPNIFPNPDNPFKVLAPKEEDDDADADEDADEAVLFDKSFSSDSKLSNSSKSIFVDAEEDFFFSFINNSIPPPKDTDGFS